MSDGEDNARLRLQRSALELFRERGFERTTAAEIAARAGLTERTFFRHFADKREALFDGEAILRTALTASMAATDAALGPLDTLFRAFHSVVPLLEGNRAFAEPRQRVIAATPALQERELAKLATLADALADGLRSRAVPPLRATLAARAGMAAFAEATVQWLDDPAVTLGDRLDRAQRELQALL